MNNIFLWLAYLLAAITSVYYFAYFFARGYYNGTADAHEERVKVRTRAVAKAVIEKENNQDEQNKGA